METLLILAIALVGIAYWKKANTNIFPAVPVVTVTPSIGGNGAGTTDDIVQPDNQQQATVHDTQIDLAVHYYINGDVSMARELLNNPSILLTDAQRALLLSLIDGTYSQAVSNPAGIDIAPYDYYGVENSTTGYNAGYIRNMVDIGAWPEEVATHFYQWQQIWVQRRFEQGTQYYAPTAFDPWGGPDSYLQLIHRQLFE